ncbi:hypothetical protein PAECIP111893_02912 [Paenibacillus plantiphilus]|uniref:Cell division protein DivIVA n=1 Tax=Paenibacillus plantiphilus TaxID=2905650 RepID=A0ABN8GPT5_9BACL|nr:DUF2203 domain-containing protein [Paenibacillus plantiphilus]CAH1208828.1 hypothetical protein PAECIP111893_02912 [Paenibacillus plantiphilus]
MNDKTFTLAEANALLPQLKADLQRLQALADQYERLYRELQRRRAQEGASSLREDVKNNVNGINDGDDPFFELEGRLDFLRLEVDMEVANFTRKGVLLKMISPGLIDFPAVLDGENVLICWKEGEERITHYHSWDEGFRGRKSHPEA